MAVAVQHDIDGAEALRIAEGLLYREARHLDRQQWDEWLALYREDAEYWVPSWDTEHRLTADPRREVSLMYYADRSGLEDRVFRVRTGRSSASTPLPRTAHYVTNVEVEPADGGRLAVYANWRCKTYREHAEHEFWGHAEYLLAPDDDGTWRIARKKTIVKNELIPVPMDFYNI